jgi:predicted patatin/cPLA2 family phospholipase
MLGLVLTAGGARGAYQAGVLQRIGQMPALRGRPSPFPIVAGASLIDVGYRDASARIDEFEGFLLDGVAADADQARAS